MNLEKFMPDIWQNRRSQSLNGHQNELFGTFYLISRLYSHTCTLNPTYLFKKYYLESHMLRIRGSWQLLFHQIPSKISLHLLQWPIQGLRHLIPTLLFLMTYPTKRCFLYQTCCNRRVRRSETQRLQSNAEKVQLQLNNVPFKEWKMRNSNLTPVTRISNL